MVLFTSFKYVDPEDEGAAEEYITVAEYFQRRYKLRLEYPNLPLVASGKKSDPIFLRESNALTRVGCAVTEFLMQ